MRLRRLLGILKEQKKDLQRQINTERSDERLEEIYQKLDAINSEISELTITKEEIPKKYEEVLFNYFELYKVLYAKVDNQSGEKLAEDPDIPFHSSDNKKVVIELSRYDTNQEIKLPNSKLNREEDLMTLDFIKSNFKTFKSIIEDDECSLDIEYFGQDFISSSVLDKMTKVCKLTLHNLENFNKKIDYDKGLLSRCTDDVLSEFGLTREDFTKMTTTANERKI